MATWSKCTRPLAGLVLGVSLLVLPNLAAAATYYVSTGGNDGNDGLTPGTAWKTITHAAATVPAGTSGSPNVIMAAAGTYDTTSNGETFPIVFNNAYVSLTGAGSGTTFIDPVTNNDDALHIDATGIAVSGFTFQDMTNADAIAITAGGFTIANNVFDATVNDGVSFYLSETDRATSISFADMAITNNTFNTMQNGIYVDVEIDFDATVNGLSAAFGNLTISGNTLPLTSGDGIYIGNLFYPKDISNGTVTVGNFTATGNTVTGGAGGIYFYGSVYNMDNAQVTVGNVVVSTNTCTNQSAYGIYVDYWDLGYFYGTTNAVLGNLTVSGNTVQATNYGAYPNTQGIEISDIDYIEYMYDQTTVTTGNINVSSNTVDVNRYGIYFYSYGIYYIGTEFANDSVVVATGSRTISGNTLNSNGSTGLYMDLEYIGYDMYGTSAVNYGNFTISNNTITSLQEALYFYLYEAGIYIYEDASASLGSVTISGNTLTSSGNDAFYYDFEYCGYDMDRNGEVTFGPTSITGNTLNAGSGSGMYFYFYSIADIMYDNASFAMNPFTIDNNTINATGNNGIHIEYTDYYVGSSMYDNATATLPDWNITGNTIDVTGGNHGLEFYTYANPYSTYNQAAAHYGSMRIDNNTFNPNMDAGMDYGIYFWLDYVLYDANDAATATFGDTTITNNTIYAPEWEGIYIYYDNLANTLTGAPSLTMGDLEIGNNTIDTSPNGIEIEFNALHSEADAAVAIGGLNIHDNTLSGITGYGINVYYSNDNTDPGTATLTIDPPSISGNYISGTAATNDGIYMDLINNTAGITLGMPTITGNTVSGFNQGMFLENLTEASLSCNFIENNTLVGMRFNTAGTNFAVHNNSLVGNTVGLAIDNGKAAIINAQKNWWGDKLGPVACSSCNGVDPGDSGTVDFSLWLASPPQRSHCGGGFPWILFIPAITGMEHSIN